jgi:gluconokinase
LNTQTIPPVVLMGVSGSGKTTVGEALAKSLAMPFIEADDLHPKSNREKMAAGIALTDADRWPWLDAMGDKMESVRREGHGVIATCSALKRIYRDRLRAKVTGPLLFVLLDSPREVLAARMAGRKGHFMPPALLTSQLATLEKPAPDETGVIVMDGTMPVAELAAAIIDRLRSGVPVG